MYESAMSCCLLVPCRCWQLDAMDSLQRLGPPCAEKAQQTATLSQETHAQGQLALQYTQDVANLLKSFGDGINLSTFRNIQELVEDKKARKALKIATEMDDAAAAMMIQAEELTASLQIFFQTMCEKITRLKIT